MVFRDPPELVYSGLTKTIGKPRELEKNIEDMAYCDSDINISIPVEETAEYSNSKPKDYVTFV